MLLKQILKRSLSATVHEAVNGLEGLTKFHQTAPDLILLDISMPVMNGVEFLAQLRSSPKGEYTPVIVLSALADQETVKDMVQLGVSDYILKPIVRNDVLKRVAKVFDYYGRVRAKPVAKEKEKELEKKTRPKKDEERILSIDESGIIIIDVEIEFRMLFQSLFGHIYDIQEAANGPEGINLFLKKQPAIVLVGENLPVLNEVSTARKLHELDPAGRTLVYYCSYNGKTAEGDENEFDGVLKKSTLPNVFIKEFSEKLLKEFNERDLLEEYLQKSKTELTAIVRQIMGGNKQQDIVELENSQVKSISNEMHIVARLEETSENSTMYFIMYGSTDELSSITKNTHEYDLSMNKDVTHSLQANVLEIAKAYRNTLKDKGFVTREPEGYSIMEPLMSDDYELLLRVPFKTQYWEKFVVCVAVDPLHG